MKNNFLKEVAIYLIDAIRTNYEEQICIKVSFEAFRGDEVVLLTVIECRDFACKGVTETIEIMFEEARQPRDWEQILALVANPKVTFLDFKNFARFRR